jgi:hypothetical protein
MKTQPTTTENTMTTMQHQLPNGNWIDCVKPEVFVARAASYQHRPESEIIADLDAGKTVRWDSDWSDNIRREPAPVAAAPAPVLVRCSCGHSVPRAQMMNASLGTSCPRCYDRMSE